MLRPGNACKGGKELKTRKQCVSNMIVVSGFVPLGEATGKKMIPMGIA
jgi:hypothetical protein